jgi:hypothetical protein
MEGHMGRFHHRLAHFALFGIVALMLSVLTDPAGADPLDNWHWRNPLPGGNYGGGVAYGNNTFVVMGAYGAILTSHDGINWTDHSLADVQSGFGPVAYGGGTFVAVGGDGSKGNNGTAVTSPDGVAWTLHPSVVLPEIRAICFGASLFVVVCENGNIFTAPDGITWTQKNSGISSAIEAVNFTNGLFVAAGDHGVVLTSNDGITWNARTIGRTGYDYPGAPNYEYCGVAWGNGRWVVIGADVNHDNILESAASTDGVSWTLAESQIAGGGSLFYVNGMFVRPGNGNSLTSPDGLTWTEHFAPSGPSISYLAGIAYGAGLFVGEGIGGSMWASTDGAAWFPTTPWVTLDDLCAVAYGNHTFVAAGNNGAILRSTDGLSWTRSASPVSSEIRAVVFSEEKGLFLAVGDNGTILASADGNSWTATTVGADCVSHAAWGNNKLVAISQQAIYMSSDGARWTVTQKAGSGFFCDVAYGDGLFVVVGQLFGTVLTSPDGITWTPRNIPGFDPRYLPDNTVGSIAFGNGTFLAWRNAGNLTSSDGINWEPLPALTNLPLVYLNGSFFAISANISSSKDGLTWVTHHPEPRPENPMAMAFGNNTYVIVGLSGEILQSDPIGQPPSADPPGTTPASGGGGGGGCFIATAAYGSYLDPHVVALRHFRDRYLLSNTPGIAFVRFYYRHSPPLASFIGDHKTLRLLTRWALTPLVYLVEFPFLKALVLLPLAPLAVYKRRRSSRRK